MEDENAFAARYRSASVGGFLFCCNLNCQVGVERWPDGRRAVGIGQAASRPCVAGAEVVLGSKGARQDSSDSSASFRRPRQQCLRSTRGPGNVLPASCLLAARKQYAEPVICPTIFDISYCAYEADVLRKERGNALDRYLHLTAVIG